MQWLQDVFIPYLDKWESSVKARPETSFSKSDKERMLLSAETRLGLRMTGIVTCDSITVAIQKKNSALSLVGLVKTIFSLPEVKGKKLSLLSGHLCQDPLENYFGCQRQRGGTNEHPNSHQFYQNAQALRIVDSFVVPP